MEGRGRPAATRRGPLRDLRARSLAYPPKDQFLSYRSGTAPATSNGNVIHCCSEHSPYDPARRARVVSGPAPQPLSAYHARALLEDRRADTAVATLGGRVFNQFFAIRSSIVRSRAARRAPPRHEASVHELTGLLPGSSEVLKLPGKLRALSSPRGGAEGSQRAAWRGRLAFPWRAARRRLPQAASFPGTRARPILGGRPIRGMVLFASTELPPFRSQRACATRVYSHGGHFFDAFLLIARKPGKTARAPGSAGMRRAYWRPAPAPGRACPSRPGRTANWRGLYGRGNVARFFANPCLFPFGPRQTDGQKSQLRRPRGHAARTRLPE